jgi:NAD(P)-dependent dehydrogenase (short-subunit alcohol dehydrogenase family)
MTIANKTILVTGANRGIGLALVEEGLRRGARRVYAGTRHPIARVDARVTPLILDVTDGGPDRRSCRHGPVDRRSHQQRRCGA